VVLAGNIGRFSLGLQQPLRRRFLQTGCVTEMILVPQLRPAEAEEVSSARRKYVVTIYSGTDCKLYDLVREGELLARRGS
jgi:hypothetical protein